MVEGRNELVTITNDLYQRPKFDIEVARGIVWSMFGISTPRASPMMALRDLYGNGRLVWGLFLYVMCGTEIGMNVHSFSYAMDPRSYAIVGAFSDALAVFNATSRRPHGYPEWLGNLPGWKSEPTCLYGPKDPSILRRAR